MNQEELERTAERAQESKGHSRHRLRVCEAAGCLSSGSREVRTALTEELERRGINDSACVVKPVGCMGLCGGAPLVASDPHERLYRGVTPKDAPALIDSIEGEAPADLLQPQDVPFFSRQRRVVLENAGEIDPTSLEEYIGQGGYQALSLALNELSPADVSRQITDSGLRGRGGGGYSTGLKWTTVAKHSASQKYVVCNADEGDPGAFMDRAILESDPFRVLEGMALAGYAVGANRGFIYIRVEYPVAVERLQHAIRQAKRSGFLGSQICGTPFSFMVELRLGAGAFVCGEETALMASIEGRRGLPRSRPPYPAEAGLWGNPTLVNNVETLANIAPIIRHGAEWYRAVGTPGSPGTKVFALAGQINNTGLIEVPMGITLREIVFDVGGGLPGGRGFKAVQTGGPSGGCIPEEHLDTPVDYESLRGLGSMMGSGGVIIIDEDSSMVEVARYFMDFSRSESCGKCIPCRVGTYQMHALLTKISAGEANAGDLDELEHLSRVVRETSLCGLGQAAPNPITSTLRYFREEYDGRLVAAAPSADQAQSGNGKEQAS